MSGAGFLSSSSPSARGGGGGGGGGGEGRVNAAASIKLSVLRVKWILFSRQDWGARGRIHDTKQLPLFIAIHTV